MKSKKVAGYVQGQQCYCCGTCRFYSGNNVSGSCSIVAGTILYHGCCNLWKLKQKGLSCCGNMFGLNIRM